MTTPVLLIVAFLAACSHAGTPSRVPTTVPQVDKPASQTLTIFAAASLTDAFSEMGQSFKAAHPGVIVALNFGGSQTLSTQIVQGAAADIFASANHTEMDKLVSADLVHKDAPKDFLTNQLIVILPKDNPAAIQTLQDLTRSGLKLVLADATVPAGKYARQILDTMSKDATFGVDFGSLVLANVVSNETDVKQVVAKVQLGEADAGIVYISDAVATPEMKTINIPAKFNIIARYPIAVLNNASQPGLASEFIAYVFSADGQAILKKWGFTPIAP